MKVRPSIQLMVTCFFLSFLLLFQSCTGYNSVNVKIHYSGEDLFRGIFFFEGEVAKKLNYFGELRDLLESIDEEDKIERKKIVDDIVDKVKEINPNFFNEFQTTIEEGHLNRIDETLNYGAEMAFVALTKSEYSRYTNLVEKATKNLDNSNYNLETAEGINEYSKDLHNELSKYDTSLTNPNQAEGRVLAVCVAVLVAAAAIFITAAAAFNYVMAAQVAALALAFNVAYAKNKAWGPDDDNENRIGQNETVDILETERFILEIAENFSKKD